jgi:hypothetical protein
MKSPKEPQLWHWVVDQWPSGWGQLDLDGPNRVSPSFSHQIRGNTLTASVKGLTWLGEDWGLRQRHKDRHREKLGSRGSNTPDERHWRPPLPSTFIYTACMRKRGEMQVKFSWVQLPRWQEQRSCGMLLFSTDYPDQVSMSCFSCKAALMTLACPWLGTAYQPRGPWHSCAHVKAFFYCLSLLHNTVEQSRPSILQARTLLFCIEVVIVAGLSDLPGLYYQIYRVK